MLSWGCSGEGTGDDAAAEAVDRERHFSEFSLEDLFLEFFEGSGILICFDPVHKPHDALKAFLSLSADVGRIKLDVSTPCLLVGGLNPKL
jgi:hypothetical protein